MFAEPPDTEEMHEENIAEDTYRIECLSCGAVEHGDPGDDIAWDKRYHRMHHCWDAEFEVTVL